MDRADKFSRKVQIQNHISSLLVQKSGMRRQFSAIDSEMVLLWHRQAPEVPLAAFCIDGAQCRSSRNPQAEVVSADVGLTLVKSLVKILLAKLLANFY